MARPHNTRKKRTQNKSTSSNNLFLKLTASATAVALSLSAALPSIAASDTQPEPEKREPAGATTLTNPDNSAATITTGGNSSKTGTAADANATVNREILSKDVANTLAESQSCADPSNPDGLAAAQKNAYDRQMTMANITMDINRIFDVRKNQACFSALTDFPDLSVSIPSMTSIITSLKNTMIKYAERKVCQVVNDVTSELLGPINEVLGEFSQNGVIDLTGMVNSQIGEELYKIDPDLGKVQETIGEGYNIDKNDVYEKIEENETLSGMKDQIEGGINDIKDKVDGAIGAVTPKTGDKAGAAVAQPSSVETLSTLSRSSSTVQEDSSGSNSNGGIKGVISSVFGN